MKKQVWLLYGEGDKGSAVVLKSTKELADAMHQVGERKDYANGDKYIIEAASMTKAELDALPDWNGF